MDVFLDLVSVVGLLLQQLKEQGLQILELVLCEMALHCEQLVLRYAHSRLLQQSKDLIRSRIHPRFPAQQPDESAIRDPLERRTRHHHLFVTYEVAYADATWLFNSRLWPGPCGRFCSSLLSCKFAEKQRAKQY